MKAIITIGITLVILYIFLIVFTKIQLRNLRIRVKNFNCSYIDLMDDERKAYYRDILKGYSPSELSYIDNFEIDGRKEVVATLLSLKLKGTIDISDNKIDIKNHNDKELLPTEKFVLKNVKDGKVCVNYNSFKNKIFEEAKEDGLVEEHPLINEAKLVCEKIILFDIVFALYVLAFVFCEITNKNSDEFFSAFSIALVLILILYYRESKVIFSKCMSRYEKFVKKMAKCEFFKRTQKGEEVNKKIEGLKKYIKDYSMLEQTGEEALEIWEDYLIYSVIFDMNSTGIVESISKLILFQ